MPRVQNSGSFAEWACAVVEGPAAPTAQLPRGLEFCALALSFAPSPSMCIIDAASCQVRKTQGERENLQDRAGAVQWVWPGLLRQLTPTLRMILSFPPSACAQMQVDYQWSAEFS